MAITADKIRPSRSIQKRVEDTFAIRTSDTVYVGAFVNFDTAGRVQSATAAASKRFAGVVEEIINDSGSAITAGTGNAGGTVKARVSWGHEVWTTIRTAARTFANLGKNVFIADNDDVTDTTAAGTATLRVKVGMLTGLNAGKTAGWVALRVFGDADAV
jgi:hypothetical protein